MKSGSNKPSKAERKLIKEHRKLRNGGKHWGLWDQQAMLTQQNTAQQRYA